MRERDLRKQALESGKTVSRAARSKLTTPSSSRANSATPSRVGSRLPSRNASDDDEDGLSDTTQWSTASIDEMISPPGGGEELEGEGTDAWVGVLESQMEEIVERKRSSAQGREEALRMFCALVTRHYAAEQLKGRTGELVAAMLKSVKGAGSGKEVVLALKALALVVVTEPSDEVYDALSGPVKTCISDSAFPAAKVAGLRCLSVATFYGGATLEETEGVMEFLLDVVSSDGAVVGEMDDSAIVTAAIEEWGFLATQMEDLEEGTETAMETFVEQLESASAEVQIAAGDCIALLYEKSYTDAESDEEPAEEDEDEDQTNGHNHGPRMVKRYTVYRNLPQLLSTLTALSKLSSKHLSKKDRKQLHITFSDILTTVEKPTRGPRYSTALDEEGREMGSRLKVAVGRGGGRMTIDKWWKLHRLHGLKRLLGEGFLVHYAGNQVVFDSLPVFVEE
ncbi:hypothetical protein LTS14_001286 [Recurvomyces mirabilis]|uniref:uncharacterized protein n=1 Tax=Recurvomyces mirabilis TaxID=574656 RepID=UPI002DDFA175|nr:hypothetical protein LTS14_001286 [Recurvomyces mirabilis]